MKTILLATATALIAVANPASAQILGGISGGSSGGGSAGVLGGVSMPSMPEPMSMPSRSADTVTRGSATGNASGSATKTINPRTGKANAQGSAQGSGSGSLTQNLNTPLNSATATGSGSGSAAGSIGGDAQLIGTDAVRGTLHQTRDKAGNTVTTYRDHAGNFVTATRDKAGNLVSSSSSVSGSASGSASSMFSGMSHNLALDGSAASNAAGSFDIKPGASLFDTNGEKIGKVREVFADGSGHVKGLLVKSGDTMALLPASSFAANGNALVTVLSAAQIASAGQGQANGAANGSAKGIFSGLSHNLALSGSAAGNVAGSFDVKPGTQLFNLTGGKIGKVKEVVADTKGRVTALVVKVKDTTATLPASDFAANGEVLVTVMSQVQIMAAGDK